jgi:hypothetical protein
VVSQLVGIAEVRVDDRMPCRGTGFRDEDASMGDRAGVVVDVGHRGGTGGEFVSHRVRAAHGGQSGADVDELPDAESYQVPYRALEEDSVRSGKGVYQREQGSGPCRRPGGR